MVSPVGTAGSSSAATVVSTATDECPLVKPKSKYCCGAGASNGTEGTARSCSNIAKTPLVLAKTPLVLAKTPLVLAKTPLVLAKTPLVLGNAPLVPANTLPLVTDDTPFSALDDAPLATLVCPCAQEGHSRTAGEQSRPQSGQIQHNIYLQ
jgi:hypothetical protein